MKKKRGNSRGFTLVELSIAMGLIAVVVALVTTFITFYYRNVQKVQTVNAISTDTNTARKAIEDWVEDYNTKKHKILCDSEIQTLCVRERTYTYDSSTKVYTETLGDIESTLTFDEATKTFIRTDYGDDGSTTVQSYQLDDAVLKADALTGNTPRKMNMDNQLVWCTLQFSNGEEQRLLCVVFSETTRDRYSWIEPAGAEE